MLVPLVCQESMFDDIRADVARSYTKLPPRQSILVDITPHYIQPSSIYHSSLPLHLYLLPFPSPFFLGSGLPYSSYARTSSASSLELSLRFLPLSVTLVIKSFDSLSCRALQLRTSIVAFIYFCDPQFMFLCFLQCLCQFIQCWSYQCPVQLPIGIFTFIFVTKHSSHSFPVLPTVLHSVGEFCIQIFALRQRRLQIFECVHSLYCLLL